MDRRETGPQETAYQRDLRLQKEVDIGKYDDKVEENGKQYRVPYRMVKQVEFSNIRPDELIDLEHAARLQYRLLLNDAVLKAKVEFAKLRIIVVYNPAEAKNLKEKISLEGLADFLAGEGVHVDVSKAAMRDLDYYKEIYSYQFDPEQIREHPPYSYTAEEWKKMKPVYEEKTRLGEQEKLRRFHEWQDSYAEMHPEMELGKAPPHAAKASLLGKLLGSSAKKKANKQEKGFWFHGV